MERNQFDKFSSYLQLLGSSGVSATELEIKRDTRYLLRYIPFEHVNTDAKLVILGITPGPNQLALAYTAAQEMLQTGKSRNEILLEVKKVGAFGSSTMRPNLLKMLKHFKFDEILGVEDLESLWGKNAHLLHATSVVPHAAFTITQSGVKMFAGSFDEVMKSDLLRECFIDCFTSSVREITTEALYVGLGTCPQSALQWCVDHGLLRPEQVLGAFCHPSTSGGSTTKYFLREVTKDQLKPTDPVLKRTDWLDHAYQQMKTATSALLHDSTPNLPQLGRSQPETKTTN